MSTCHSCIGPGRSNRTNDSLGRFRGRGWARPCRSRIRLIVRSDGTTIPWTGARSSCIRIRFDPHRGCFRRISATATSTAAVAWCGHDTGRCDPSASPATFPARYRPIQRCSVERDTPVAAATSVTVAPANTARTASRRCSTTDNTTSANLGLPESRRPAETSNSGWTKQTTVAHQLASDCRTSPGTGHGRQAAHCRIWLSQIKGRASPAKRRVSSLRCGPRRDLSASALQGPSCSPAGRRVW
jgi:hypothetical protein